MISYDDSKYLSVIAPKEDKFKEYPEASLYYLANGVMPSENTDIKLYKYPAVFKTSFRKNDYLLFLQENIQKDEETGYILIVYPLNLIQTKTVGQFIEILTNQTLSVPVFSAVYKFDALETCNQKFNDKSYCKQLLSDQNSIYKLVKKWGETGIVPIDMMRYPLMLNKNRV